MMMMMMMMRPHRFRGVCLLAAVMIALAPLGGAPASGSTAAGSNQTASLRFTTDEPGTPSGLRLRVDYVNPDAPEGKPPAVRKVVQTLAEGARIDTSAPLRCTATAELMLTGPAACPAGSFVGTGLLTIDTGLSEPARFLTEDVTFLNNTDELIFVTQDRQTGARLVTRAVVDGRRIVTEAPPLLPGAPPDGAAIDVVRADLREVVTARGSYVSTPARCPTSGYWTNTIEFTYDDGTQTVRSRSRCQR